jgi:hypothetical protein
MNRSARIGSAWAGLAVILGACQSGGPNPAAPPGPEEVAAFNAASISGPAVSRVWVTREQAAGLRMFVPPGTRAYMVGRLSDTEPDVLAWYNTAGDLVAAVEVREGPAKGRRGVHVSAGPSQGDWGPAVLTVSAGGAVPALRQPDGALRVRVPGSPRAHEAQPLLSFEGSTNLVTLVSGADSALVNAPRLEVTAPSASGAFREVMDTQGCVRVIVAPTREGAEAPVTIVNSGEVTATVLTRAVAPLTRTPGTDPDVRVVPPGASVQAAPVRGPAGNWPLAFDSEWTPDLANPDEPLAPGPVVLADTVGSATVTVRAPSPVTSALGTAGVPVSLLGPPQGPAARASGSPSVLLLGGAGAAAIATGTAVVRTRDGQESSRTFTVIPVRESMLRDAPRTTMVTPIRTGGLLAANFPPDGPTQDGGTPDTAPQDPDPKPKPGETTTSGGDGWKVPKGCLCFAGGQVLFSNVKAACSGTQIEITATVEATVSVLTIGEEGSHKVTFTPGVGSMSFVVRGDVGTNREWFTRVPLVGSTSWSMPGGGKSVSISATCPPGDAVPSASFTGTISGKGSWTEGSALDRVFRKEGGTGHVTIEISVAIEGCGGKSLTAKADCPVTYAGTGAGAVARAWLQVPVQPSIGKDTSDPCQKERAKLACFLACVGGKSADDIVNAAQGADLRNPEQFAALIKQCCPECERANNFKAVMQALLDAAEAMTGK